MIAKTHIIEEINRIAALRGSPPGYKLFGKLTGINQGQWYGVHWARWADALAEAGYQPNTFAQKLSSDNLLRPLLGWIIELGRIPTNAEMKMRRRADPSFPSVKTITEHYNGRRGLFHALKAFAAGDKNAEAVLDAIGEPVMISRPSKSTVLGWVYLLASGGFFKIGRSENVDRRLRQIQIALPESIQLIHAIETDDASGIEGYWHKRFADRRANGEWFRLTPSDIAAFKKRRFQ